ncbi:hypothetical protein AAG570_005265 [Ranatra chinensis]|uniref:Mannosyltransferase n=1 Tax=Ranatra chinensis TaxID=642074 RepID=A0ABD0YNJ5_9HEMI
MISYGRFPWKLFGVALFLRAFNLFLVQSQYVPDEYWQSVEVAHRRVFGYGHLTWEWSKAIRSSLYVTVISGLYRLLAFLDLDLPQALIFAPRILQGVLSALADVYFVRWVHEKRSGQYSWAFISWMTCYFVWYCSTRTLVNTFEMNLTAIALYHFPWTPKTDSTVFVTLVTLLVFVRPTASVIWLPLVLINVAGASKPILHILRVYVPVGIVVGSTCVALDSYFYDRIVITPWNFFKMNVLENIGEFYGSHSAVWFFYCGVPVVLGIHTLPFYYASVRTLLDLSHVKRKLMYDVETQMVVTVFWSLIVFSFIAHKEFRFLLPLVPMMLYISSTVWSKWSVNAKLWHIYSVGFLLITANFCAVLFLGQFHKAGGLDTMKFLREDLEGSDNSKLLFLTPCHSLPLYSHLHKNVSTRFLTCEPNFTHDAAYIDEAELFYKNSTAWLRREYPASGRDALPTCSLPTHIIAYNSLNITNFLHSRNYSLAKSFFDSYVFTERTGSNLNVYKRKGPYCA